MGPDDLELDEEDLPIDPPEDEPDAPDTGTEDEQPDSEDDEVDAQPASAPQDVDRQPDRQSSRSERRHQVQQQAIRERDQRIADLERRMDAVLSQSRQPIQQTMETPEQREQRLSLLDPVERMQVEMREARVTHERQLQTMQFTLQDQGDKSTYDAKALVDPLYSKWAPKVESELAALRAKGQNVGREQLLKYLIGDAALAGRKSNGKQRADAERRVARNRVAPSNARSDTRADRRPRNEAEARERRLENTNI